MLEQSLLLEIRDGEAVMKSLINDGDDDEAMEIRGYERAHNEDHSRPNL